MHLAEFSVPVPDGQPRPLRDLGAEVCNVTELSVDIFFPPDYEHADPLIVLS